MNPSRKPQIILVSLLLAIYAIYFSVIGNFEFLAYIAITAFVFFLIIKFDNFYNFPTYSIWLFVIWVVLHMLGGSLIINESGSRLYAWVIWNLTGAPYYILKYDQIVHTYTYFVFSVLVYHALKKHIKPNQKVALALFTILASIGIGALNEVVEFAMVVFANAAEGVGDYYNTALDMVFNLIGSIIGVWFVNKRIKPLTISS